MRNIELDNIRRDRAALVAELEQAGAKFRGSSCLCPFHDDHQPSGGIYEKDGVWKYKCLACGAGGDIFDVKALANGTSAADEIKKLSGPKTQKTKTRPALTFANLDAVREYLRKAVGEIEGEHIFPSDSGDMVQIVFRLLANGQKTFRPVHLADNGYVLGAPPKPWPLYNLPNVTGADTVIVVEGEKCADALMRYGFVATTSASGAKCAGNTDWTPLAGKAVTLWPDCDIEGRKYMLDVEQILESLQSSPRVSILDPQTLDLSEKEDVADFVEQLKVLNKTDVEIASSIAEGLKKGKLRSIVGEVQQRVADIKAGRYSCVEWPWDSVSRFTRALLPSTVTLLVGNPGASKSFMALQAFAYWQEQGLRTSLYEIEEDKVFHLTRVLAQKSGQADVTDPQWVKDNVELAERIVSEHRGFLDSFGRVLYASPDVQPTLTELAQWIEQQAKTGCRIIGIDPITSAERGGEPWVVDGKFLQAIKRTATDYRCSIILVTHPIKAISFPDLSQVAGSAAYQRFSQNILWLESHEEKHSKVKTAVGTTYMTHNRTLHILKARNGKGMGLKLAFQFDSDSLTLHELGLILKERKGE